MAEMPAAAAAMHNKLRETQRTVVALADRARQWLPEARPAGAALELGLRRIIALPAAGTGEDAGTVLVVERATSGAFGTLMAQHIIGGRRELLLFLCVG